MAVRSSASQPPPPSAALAQAGGNCMGRRSNCHSPPAPAQRSRSQQPWALAFVWVRVTLDDPPPWGRPSQGSKKSASIGLADKRKVIPIRPITAPPPHLHHQKWGAPKWSYRDQEIILEKKQANDSKIGANPETQTLSWASSFVPFLSISASSVHFGTFQGKTNKKNCYGQAVLSPKS